MGIVKKDITLETTSHTAYAKFDISKGVVKKPFAVKSLFYYTGTSTTSDELGDMLAIVDGSVNPQLGLALQTIQLRYAHTASVPSVMSETDWLISSAFNVAQGESFYVRFFLTGTDESIFCKDYDQQVIVKLTVDLNPSGSTPFLKDFYGRLVINTLGKFSFVWL